MSKTLKMHDAPGGQPGATAGAATGNTVLPVSIPPLSTSVKTPSERYTHYLALADLARSEIHAAELAADWRRVKALKRRASTYALLASRLRVLLLVGGDA